jgi:hypothetical protein
MTAALGIPWLPASLRAHGLTENEVTRLSYVVVDEIVDDTVTLAVHSWPVADKDGRVRFPDLEACRHAAVPRRALETQLYRGWLEREPRLGDVFGFLLTDAAKRRLSRQPDVRWQRGLRSLVDGSVYDLSPDARVVAKLSYYAAMAPVLAEEEVDHWALSAKAEPHVEEAKVRPRPAAEAEAMTDA